MKFAGAWCQFCLSLAGVQHENAQAVETAADPFWLAAEQPCLSIALHQPPVLNAVAYQRRLADLAPVMAALGP